MTRKNRINEDSFIEVGRIRTAWGVRGQLAVEWNNGSCPVDIAKDDIFIESGKNCSLKKYTVLKDHRHGKGNIIDLKEVGSREEAKNLRGLKIFVRRSDLPGLEEDKYYAFQLLGIKVKTTEGKKIGTIVEIFPTGSNDVYVVKDGKNEILIPAIKDVIKDIDFTNEVMTVELIEGLV